MVKSLWLSWQCEKRDDSKLRTVVWGRLSMSLKVAALMPKIIPGREAAGSFATSAASEYMKRLEQLEG